MGDLAEETKQGHHNPNENKNNKLPWWKALRRASNESRKSANKDRSAAAVLLPPPVAEICIPTYCLHNVTESPQDYFDRMLVQRGYTVQRTPCDPDFRQSNNHSHHLGRNDAHQGILDNQWKAVHAVLSQQGSQLLLQTDHTGQTPLMYVEPEDWIVWIQFLDSSILDRYWPDPNAPPVDDDEDDDSYSDVGSVGSVAAENLNEKSEEDDDDYDDDDDENVREEQATATTADNNSKTEKQIKEKNLALNQQQQQQEQKERDDALAREYFQAVLEARG